MGTGVGTKLDTDVDTAAGAAQAHAAASTDTAAGGAGAGGAGCEKDVDASETRGGELPLQMDEVEGVTSMLSGLSGLEASSSVRAGCMYSCCCGNGTRRVSR